MSRVSLLNRDPNFKPNSFQKITDKGVICEGIGRDDVEMISAPFEESRKDDKSISSMEDLQLYGRRVKERENIKKRVLVKEENGGYVLVCSLTFVGILSIGALIFMAIKFIILG